MKFLVVFLLVGLGFASAYTNSFDDTFEVNRFEKDDQDPLLVGGWIADRIRDSLQIMIDGFEKALKEGKTISERAFKKAEDLYNKLVDWGIDLGDELKEAFERIRKEIGYGSDQPVDSMHVGGWIADRIRDSLQIMIDGFEKALKEGKTISERAFKKAEDLYNKLVDWGIDLGDELKEAFERIRKEIGYGSVEPADSMHVGGWIADRIRDSLQIMIDGFEKALKEGKTISERAFKKAEDLYNKLVDWGIDLGDELKEAFERIRKEIGYESDQPSDSMHVGGWIADRIRDSLQIMIDGFEKALKEGKTISERAFKKAEDLYNKLVDWGIDLGDELKEAFERIRKEIGYGSVQSADSMHVGGFIADRIRDSLQIMIDGFEKALKEGKTISERAFKKAEDLYNKLVDWGIDLGDELKEAFERIRKEIGHGSVQSADSLHVGGFIADRIRDSLQIMIDGFEKALKEGKTISERAFKKAEDLYNKLVDWGIDLGDELKEAFERIRKEIGYGSNQPANALHVGGWIADRIRDSLQIMIDGFEKALKEGKTISERAFKKAEDLYNKLVDWGIDLGDELKEAFERIRKEIGYGTDETAVSMHVGGWITDRIRDSLQVLIDGFEKALKEGKTISERAFRKAEELYQKLLDWGIDVGEEIKESLDRIRKEIGVKSVDHADSPMHIGDWITDRVRDSLQILIDGFEKAMKEGKIISERSFKKAEQLYQKLMDWGIDVGEEIKEAFDRIRGYIDKY